MELSSYLQQVIRWPSTCGLDGSKTAAIQFVSVCLLIILICFTVARFKVRSPSAIRRSSDRQVVLCTGTPIKWCEATHYFAVIFAVASILLFMISSMHGLGVHICELGLTDQLVAFIRQVLETSQAGTNAALLAYLDAHSTTLNPDLSKSLQLFLSDFKGLLVLLYVCDAFYILAVNFQKASNDFSLLSMFGYNDSIVRKIVRYHLALTLANFVLTLGLGFFGSWPPQSSWEIATSRSWALSSAFIYRFTAASDLLLDLGVIWVPFWKLTKLQLPASEKSILYGLFSSQLMAIIVGLARIFCLAGLFGQDLSYNAANPLILTMVQLTVYVVSFSIPILRHLIQDIKSYFSPPPPLPRPTMGNSSSNLVNHGGRAVRGSVISVWSQWSGHADIERDFHDEPVHLPVYSSTDSSKSINDSPAFEKCVV